MSRVSYILGLLASLAVVLGLVLTGWQIQHDLSEKRIESWQEVAVFSVCVGAGYKGATLDQIKSKYADAAKDLPKGLPREALQTDAIRKALISLISENVVALRGDDTFAAVRAPRVPLQEFEPHTMDDAAGFILETVRDSPHVVTEQDLLSRASKQFPDLTTAQITQVMNGISVGPNRMISFDEQGRASLVNSTPK